ncbi:inositol monophosphatase family protein [Demequina sp.]|uniref:inositol monophosphatase family protein n=1 Tax=Demequina sp. TaxID=2050685 RepID=UPI0025BAB428|nr:inositol monophosphatase family protein [Demequina sp.]
MTYADDLALALAISDEVDALTIAGSLSDFAVETKNDDTPVTAIDRAAEHLVRDRLTAARPNDAIVGEEFGASRGALDPVGGKSFARRWVVDPIDGTKNFVRGVPAWATLIGLVDGDEAVVGVVSAPALGRRWYAALGSGAWGVTHVHGFPTAPRRLQVSTVTNLSEASVSFSSLSGWEERGMLGPFLDLTRAARRVRAFGDFWSYMMVAEGQVDVACEPELALHDMVALAPIVTEAGGRFTSLGGESGPFGGDALASNGALHSAVLATLTAA